MLRQDPLCRRVRQAVSIREVPGLEDVEERRMEDFLVEEDSVDEDSDPVGGGEVAEDVVGS